MDNLKPFTISIHDDRYIVIKRNGGERYYTLHNDYAITTASLYRLARWASVQSLYDYYDDHNTPEEGYRSQWEFTPLQSRIDEDGCEYVPDTRLDVLLLWIVVNRVIAQTKEQDTQEQD